MAPQTPEAQAFLRRLNALPQEPGVDLTPVIKPALDDEAALRRLFAQDRTNARLNDPYVGLVDIFGPNTERIKKSHARIIKDEDNRIAQYVMPLDEATRRKDGELSMASTIEDFKSRFAIFTEGALSQLTDWNNVVAAGGSVLACLMPLPEKVEKQGSKRAVRKYYHREAYPASDVDLFLYGLTPEAAEAKCVLIHEAIRDSVPWDVVAIRTKNAVSIHCQYPYRPIQIVLRLYHSPAEILAGFDVDSACVAYDGQRVYAAPRAVIALMTQCNRVAMDRRSPSYEMRLAKYAARGFEIHVPDLRRADLDPTIFERSLVRVVGLARLLVLEKFTTQEAREGFVNQRRAIRGRPPLPTKGPNYRRRVKGNITVDLKLENEVAGLPMSDYDILFHIPYGPGINARGIGNMVYKNDLGLNSTFNPKNKGRRLHRHPFFFGTMPEAIEDCCKHCPKPETDEEREIAEKEFDQYISGRIGFLENDPGRQAITGSFHPIDSGEWSDQAYIKPLAKLFSLIAAHDRSAVNEFLKRNAEAINTRDHLGRTPLQFALMCSAEDISIDLIEQGGRMTARVVDGRTALHLAAQFDLERVVAALLRKSTKNKEEAERRAQVETGAEPKNVENDDDARNSSEDDWSEDHQSSEEDYAEAKKVIPKTVASEDADPLDENEDEPDILDLDLPDWDQCLTPLGYAIIDGNLPIVKLLVDAGADCKTPREVTRGPMISNGFLLGRHSHNNKWVYYPLALTGYVPDENVGAAIAEYLVTHGGASCSAADNSAITVFHQLVSLNKPLIVRSLLISDPTSKAASRFLSTQGNHQAIHPIVQAFNDGHRAMVAVLLAYGNGRAFIDQETFDRSMAANPTNPVGRGLGNFGTLVVQPLEASLAQHNDLWRLVFSLEPEAVKNPVPKNISNYGPFSPRMGRTVCDFDSIEATVQALTKLRNEPDPVTINTDLHNLGTAYNPGAGTFKSIFDLSETEVSEKVGWEAEVITLERDMKKLRDEQELKRQSNFRLPPNALPDWEVQQKRSAQERREQSKKLLAYFEEVLEEMKKLGCQSRNDNPGGHVNSAFGVLQGGPIVAPGVLQARQTALGWAGGPFGGPVGMLGGLGGLLGGLPDPLSETKALRRYYTMTNYGESEAGNHLYPLYDELFEACWVGDTEKVKAMCLPSTPGEKPAAGRDLLQVTVVCRYADFFHNYGNGYTPLTVALRARKWETAKEIVNIAEEQLEKDDDDEKPVSRSRRSFKRIINFNDEEDGEDDSDGDSVDTDATPKKLGYNKLAERFHTVTVNVQPCRLLDVICSAIINGEIFSGTPLTVAIRNKDLEAFKLICDLMESLTTPQQLSNTTALEAILAEDSPEMLEEYIKRTGDGLVLPKESEADKKQTTDPRHDEEEDGPRIYLGLDIHGKKRKDLARSGDPDAPPAFGEPLRMPILWRAAKLNALNVLSYLTSPAVFQAYKHYATSSKTPLAKRLLATVVPKPSILSRALGMLVNNYNESALLVCIAHWNFPMNDILPTLEKLKEIAPAVFEESINARSKTHGVTALLAVVANQKSAKLFDWLLKQGADPSVRDVRGWNILHVLANAPGTMFEFVQHVLTTLPAETVEALFAQRSHGHRNTPLMIAVKHANIDLIGFFLQNAKKAVEPTLLTRDYTGATPLHTAILNGNSEIVGLLINVGPPDALYLENAVGSTPIEMAKLAAFNEKFSMSGPCIGATYFQVHVDNYLPLPGFSAKDDQDISQLRSVVESILSSGSPTKNPEVVNVLKAFADRTEVEYKAYQTQKNQEVAMPIEEQQQVDYGRKYGRDPVATLAILSKAVVPVHRRVLVHLHDVQQAVISAVEEQTGGIPRRLRPNFEGVDGDEDQEEVERAPPSALGNVGWARVADGVYRSQIPPYFGPYPRHPAQYYP